MAHLFMQKFKVYAVVAIASLFVASCSSDDSDFPDEPNIEFVRTLARSDGNVTYKLSKWRSFRMPTGINEWKEVDLSQVCGAFPIIPSLVIFDKGKVWTPVDLFSLNFGPSPFALPWNAYKKVTNRSDLKLFVSVDFDYNADENSMLIASRRYDVLKFEPSEIVLAMNYHYYGGEYHNGGEGMDWYYLTPTKLVEINQQTDLGFENELDAYAYILKCAREQFGDSINLNYIYSPGIIFDDPVVDLVELERYLERLFNQAGQ